MTDSHYLGWVVLCGPTIAPVSPPAPVVPVVTIITSHTGTQQLGPAQHIISAVYIVERR